MIKMFLFTDNFNKTEDHMKLRRLIVSVFLCVLVGVQFVYPAEFPEAKPEKVGLFVRTVVAHRQSL